MRVADIVSRVRAAGNPDIAAHAQGFFKTGPGEYGEGDRFVGVRMPVLRALSKDYDALPLRQVSALLRQPWHEVRLLALLIMVRRARRAEPELRQTLYETYLAHTEWINNWDLVDCSAEPIVGACLWPRLRQGVPRVLADLARSASLWERRIAVLTTFHFIRQGRGDITLALAGRLLHDEEDLIHKAVGWMLREVGNRDRAAEMAFLDQHAARMPRTMLRYAIEKFPEDERQRYLKA